MYVPYCWQVWVDTQSLQLRRMVTYGDRCIDVDDGFIRPNLCHVINQNVRPSTQQFLHMPNGGLRHVITSKCLQAQPQPNGMRLTLAPCMSSPLQVWNVQSVE